jgi:hypothetical protein
MLDAAFRAISERSTQASSFSLPQSESSAGVRSATTRACKYNQVRICLLRKGYTLRSWALAHGYPPSTVQRAAKRGGRRATSRKIAEHLKREMNQK